MEVLLLGQHLDWAEDWQPTAGQRATFADLELAPVVAAATQGDSALADWLTRSLFAPLPTQASLRYRQDTVAYALAQPEYFHALYSLAQQTNEAVQRHNWIIGKQAAAYSLASTTSMCQQYLNAVATLLTMTPPVGSLPAGVQTFRQSLERAFGADQLAQMQALLARLRGDQRYAVAGQLTASLKSTTGERELPATGLLQQLTTRLHLGKKQVSFNVSPRDTATCDDLARLENRASQQAAVLMLKIYRDLRHYFKQLAAETGWLVAVTRLVAQLADPVTFVHFGDHFVVTGLTNVVLRLTTHAPISANSLTLAPATALVITGANQGGKTTFLRALGQAVLMGAAGIPIAATDAMLPVFNQVLTHFKREEDDRIQHGKLAEELQRMQDRLTEAGPNVLWLMNESFTSTNEHEGSQINAQITQGLVERQDTVITVTHQYEYSQLLHSAKVPHTFLRAQRRPDGSRPFVLTPDAPERTSFGTDIFDQYFGDLTPVQGGQ